MGIIEENTVFAQGVCVHCFKFYCGHELHSRLGVLCAVLDGYVHSMSCFPPALYNMVYWLFQDVHVFLGAFAFIFVFVFVLEFVSAYAL